MKSSNQTIKQALVKVHFNRCNYFPFNGSFGWCPTGYVYYNLERVLSWTFQVWISDGNPTNTCKFYIQLFGFCFTFFNRSTPESRYFDSVFGDNAPIWKDLK